MTDLGGFLSLGALVITLADSSTLNVADLGGGSIDPKGDVLICEKGIFLPELIDTQDVVSVTIGSTVFPVA